VVPGVWIDQCLQDHVKHRLGIQEVAAYATPHATRIEETQHMKKIFKAGDKVYWRSKSNGKSVLKTGRIAAIVPAGKKMWEIVEANGFQENHVLLKLHDKRFAPARLHESYLVSVTWTELWKVPHKKPKLYWPIVNMLKHDTRQPLPQMFMPEDE
jgi:hypothetical protein